MYGRCWWLNLWVWFGGGWFVFGGVISCLRLTADLLFVVLFGLLLVGGLRGFACLCGIGYDGCC